MLEEAVEFTAVQRAPRTVQVISGLRLLPCVIVVEELGNKRMDTTHHDHTAAHGQSEMSQQDLWRSHADIIQHRNLQWKDNQGNTLHFDTQYKGLGSQIGVLYCVCRLL